MLKDFLKKLCGFSIGPIFGALIGFITIPVTTYFILPAEYGKVSMFTLVQSLFSVFAYLGFEQAYTRFYNEEENKEKLMFNCMLIPMILSVLLALILIFIPNVISYLLFESSVYTTPIYMLAISIPFIILETFLLLNLRMNEKAFRYSFFYIFIKLSIFLFTLFFITLVRKDFLAIVYSNIIGQFFGDLVLLIFNFKNIKISKKLIDKKLLKELSKFALPLALVSIIGWLFNSIDKVFLRTMSTYEQLGFYNVAMKISNVLLIIQSSFTSFWVPIAYKWHKQNKDKSYYILVSHSLNLLMSVLFLFILLFKDLIPIFISDSYTNAIYIIPFLLFYPIMYTVSETTTLGIGFSKKSYLNLVVSISSIAVNFILNFLLISKFQAVGVSIATGISYIVFFWTRTLISKKLWFNFKLNKYIYTTIILLIASIFNVFEINKLATYSINIVSIIFILLVHIDIIKYLYNKIIKKIFSTRRNV